MNFDGIRIARLSGPVYFAYLLPPPAHPEWPIVMLLGDKHGQMNLCEDCNLPECITVFSTQFVRLLDTIAKKYPVDFFTESAELYEGYIHPQESQVLAHHMLSTVQDCHQTWKRRTPHSDCPTKYVRWHHSDPRKMNKYIESMFDMFSVFLKIKIPAGRVVTFAEAMRRLNTIRIFHEMSEAEMKIVQEYASGLSELILDTSKSVENRIEAVTKFLLTMLEMHKEKSRVLKQMGDNIDNIDNIDWPSVLFNNLYNWSRDDFTELDGYSDVFPQIQALIRSTDALEMKIDDSERVEIAFILMNMIVSKVHALLVDIYTLSRMFKMPKDNDRAVLAIGYFGSAHSRHIAEILITRMKYSLLDEIVNLDTNCIIFQNPIEIKSNVEELAEARYAAHPERLQKYQQVLEEEKLAREQRSSARVYRKATSKPRSRSPSQFLKYHSLQKKK